MIDLKYSLVIEATEDPNFFWILFSRSRRVHGDRAFRRGLCLHKAKWGMEEHIALLQERDLPIPKANPNRTIVIQNEKLLEKAAA